MKQTRLMLLLLSLAFSAITNVKGDAASNLLEAFNALGTAGKKALEAIIPIGDIVKVLKCVEGKAFPIRTCNLNSSFDPFFYLKECASGTPIQQLVQKTLGKVNTTTVPFGVPPVVSHNRCDCDRVPLQKECVSNPFSSPELSQTVPLHDSKSML